MAKKLVDRFAIWSGVAGLIPLPVVDVLAVGGLQVQMLRRLSQIYDVRVLRKPRQSADRGAGRHHDPGDQRHGRRQRD